MNQPASPPSELKVEKVPKPKAEELQKPGALELRVRSLFDPNVPGFLVRVLALQALLMGALLGFAGVVSALAAVPAASGNAPSAFYLSGMGQFGDVLGGISNFVTTLVVVASAVYATGQFAQFKRQHAIELRSEAALRIWQSVKRFVLDFSIRCNKQLKNPKYDLSEREDHEPMLMSFGDAVSDAEILFEDKLVDLMRQQLVLSVDTEKKNHQARTKEALKEMFILQRQIKTLLESHVLKAFRD